VNKIPHSVIGVAAKALAETYTHSSLDSLFLAAGFPGDPPPGNKVDKSLHWLRLANAQCADPLTMFGALIAEFMETEPASHYNSWTQETETDPDPRAPVILALSKKGLSYAAPGIIVGSKLAVPTKSLGERLAKEGIEALDIEYRRAYDAIEADPAAAVTAASSILESLFKTYLESSGIDLPVKQTLSTLWSETSKSLGLQPGQMADDDLKRILSGIYSVVDGVGALRTHEGSAHGRSDQHRRAYRILPRHARLAVHSAHTIALFVLETWDARRGG